MKSLFKRLFGSAIMMLTLVSCNNDLVIDNDKTKIEIQSESSFYQGIDSINEKFSELSSVCLSRRGYLSDYGIQNTADAIGGHLGGKILSWASASIGAASGNPAIAVGGYLVGRKVGKIAGSAAASIGAAWVLDKIFSSTSPATHSLILRDGYAVNVEDPNNISDGELHNLIVAKLLKNKDKYITEDGDLDFDILVEDAYEFENEFCPSDEYWEYKSLCLSKTIEQTKRIVNSSMLSINDDNEAFIDDIYENLIPEAKMSNSEYGKVRYLIVKTLPTYMSLEKTDAENYSIDIDNVIENSDFNRDIKNDLKSSNNVLLYSTLIWREVE